MDITEVRQRFAAFGSGELTGAELRTSIRRALTEQPQLCSTYIALAEAYRRANVIDAELQSGILADITEVTGPRATPPTTRSAPVDDDPRTVFFGAADIGARSHEPAERESSLPDLASGLAGLRADRRGEVPQSAEVPQGEPSSAPAPAGSADESAASIRSTSGRTGTGSAGTTTGTTTGSAWDSPERLAEAAAPLSPGSVLKERFQLTEEIGRGGMGVVYKALDRRSADFKDRHRYVAIKVLNEEFKRHPLAVRALQREARKAQKLAHPNIVTVFDFDRDGGNVYMVMELLSGHGLDEIVKTEARAGLRVERVTQIVKALGAALSYAHEQGIVHSDFKPSNAYITDEGVVKVLDFGIARAAPTRADRGDKTVFDAGQLGAISPPYASLEMLNGQEPDVRDDVYALACVTYELLTGRHPFNRIDAAKACEAGLQPAPVRALSRTQWRVLRQAMAFHRADRIPQVDAFVSQFIERPSRTAWWVAGAALAIAIPVALIVPGQWEAHQANALARSLASPDGDTFSAALARLRQAPASLRERVLLDEPTRTALIAHFRSSVQASVAPPAYDYAHAKAIIADVQRLLPDSSEVSALSKQLDADQQVQVRRQVELRDGLLGQGVFVASQGPDNATAALERIRKIDPDNPALVDQRVTIAYLAGAGAALANGRPDLAKEIADGGLTFTPNESRLLDLKDRAGTELLRTANAHRVADLEQKLGTLDPVTAGFLDEVLANRDDLSVLATLAPASPALTRIQSSLQTVVQQRIKQQLADHDIAGARNLLLNVGELLPEQVLSGVRASVVEAARTEEDRALDTLDRLRSAALTGRLAKQGASSAMDLFDQIQRAGASPDILAEARDLVAYGYLRLARRAWSAGDRTTALKELTEGAGLEPSKTLQQRLTAEQTILQAPQSGGGRGKAAGSDADAARQRFAETLRSSTLGPSELAAMAEALDRLEALGSSPQEIDSGLRQIEDRVIGEVGRLQQQSGTEATQLFARQASATVLGSERIAEVARQLRHSAVRSSGVPFSPETLAVRNQLADAIAKPDASQTWANSIRKLMQKLSAAVPANDPGLADARRVATATFVKAAVEAREGRRYSEATSLLTTARQFDPQSPDIAREVSAIEHDRSAAEATAANEQQRAGIDALKRKLADQAASGDMTGAMTTANALRRVLGGSVYVAQEMPQILIEGYGHLAKTQMAAGRVDSALETLAAGRRKFGTAPELKNLEAHYVLVGDVYDRLSTAVALNASEQRRNLDQLRAAEAADYPMIERMLARTLANRIADQRAANRSSVTAALLEAGRKIFPEYSASLEEGKAGALPKTGIPVTTEEVEK